MNNKLTDEQKKVLFEKGTEAPFTGKYYLTNQKGEYMCANCGQKLFDSKHKHTTLSGWPSFDMAIPGSIKIKPDHSYGLNRTEVTCSKCGGHLGHLFNEEGTEYCINSAALDFKKKNA